MLLPLFTYLRRFILLGVGDYLLALDMLRAGKGLDSADDLQFTCRLLWAKSPEDQELFDQAFARLVAPRLALRPTASSPRPSSLDSQLAPSPKPSTPAPEIDTPVPLHSELRPTEEHVGAIPLTPRVAPQSGEETLRPIGTYQLTPRPPISRREMANIWRHLHRPRRDGPLLDLDVDGTIKSICRQGFFLRPVMRARYRNQVRLLILIDRSASMVPYTSLVDALVGSMHRGGQLGRMAFSYFRNYPGVLLSPSPTTAASRTMAHVLAEHADDSSVLIVSDAGAARRTYCAERITHTHAFLWTLNAYTYRYAWLNPLPPECWERTSAAEIACMAPMFALNREGLIGTVNILRGHPFPPGVRLDGKQ